MMWSNSVSALSVALVLLAGAGWMFVVSEPERGEWKEPEPVESPAVRGPDVPRPDPAPEAAPLPVLVEEPVSPCGAAGFWPRAMALARGNPTGAEADDASVAAVLAGLEPCTVVSATGETAGCQEDEECVQVLMWVHRLLENLTERVDPLLANVSAAVDQNVSAVVDQNVSAAVDQNVTVVVDEDTGSRVDADADVDVAASVRAADAGAVLVHPGPVPEDTAAEAASVVDDTLRGDQRPAHSDTSLDRLL